jgi:ribosome-binding protein aMBF1 (putative translation factor)
VCGSKKADRKAKIEGSVLRVCDECVKLGEEIPVFVKSEGKKIIKKSKENKKNSITIGDVIEVS